MPHLDKLTFAVFEVGKYTRPDDTAMRDIVSLVQEIADSRKRVDKPLTRLVLLSWPEDHSLDTRAPQPTAELGSDGVMRIGM